MIEVKFNAEFLSTFGVKIDIKNERKRVSRMCENAYLSIKNPKDSRALKQALEPGCRLLTSLARLHFAMLATFGLRSWAPPPPLDQILDPHLCMDSFYCHINKRSEKYFLWGKGFLSKNINFELGKNLPFQDCSLDFTLLYLVISSNDFRISRSDSPIS